MKTNKKPSPFACILRRLPSGFPQTELIHGIPRYWQPNINFRNQRAFFPPDRFHPGVIV
jgi:hypothetical protein